MFAKEIKLFLANRYFAKQTEKVFVNRETSGLSIETFEKYLSYRYRDNCYYYSAYAIMGLNSDDFLVRGSIRIPGNTSYTKGGYKHGWVEFTHNCEEFVFDSMCIGIVPKDEWYKVHNPVVTSKLTQRELLILFLSPENSKILEDGTYEIKEMIDNSDMTYTVNAFSQAKIKLYNQKIHKFIAYSDPSC